MRKWVVLAICLGWSGVSYAGTYEDAAAAYNRQDYKLAMLLWQSLADLGDAHAQTFLGFMYDHGEGVPQDYVESMKWYRKAANQDDAHAQYNLGFKYERAQGVPQDYAEAVKWYRKAADQGYGSAQNNLAFMYEQGRGVSQDFVQALKWYNLATSKLSGTEGATVVKNRDIVAAKMTPAQIAEAQNLAREWKPTNPTSGK